MANILLAEDDPTVRLVLERTLQKSGHTVYVSRDGLEALATLDSTPIDLIITDIRMPVLNGADLIRIARSGSPHPRIVLMSGDVRSRQYTDALEQADLVLAKPIDLASFPNVIAKLLAAEA